MVSPLLDFIKIYFSCVLYTQDPASQWHDTQEIYICCLLWALNLAHFGFHYSLLGKFQEAFNISSG